MCEVLVRAVDGTCQDPTANPLKGFPVVVKPDGHVWGNGERLPEYVVIKIPNISVSQVEKYAGRWFDYTTMTVLGRRRYQLAATIVDQAVANGGTLTLTRPQFTRNVIDRAA